MLPAAIGSHQILILTLALHAIVYKIPRVNTCYHKFYAEAGFDSWFFCSKPHISDT